MHNNSEYSPRRCWPIRRENFTPEQTSLRDVEAFGRSAIVINNDRGRILRYCNKMSLDEYAIMLKNVLILLFISEYF